jgi:chlorite dismutase
MRFTTAFWEAPALFRQNFFTEWQAEMKTADGILNAACQHFYQVAPLSSTSDALLWNALPVEDPLASAHFFEQLARTTNARRRWLEPVEALWGYTRPSQYARGGSSQEIDPLQTQRQTYLVAYPFVKTADWYLLSRDTRQGMMNQHIRIGHQYPEITQLLLYSTGLQDQEFVVVYETEDLNRFSELVSELRGSEARRYTQRDTPVYTAIWRSAEAMGALFGGEVAP